MKSKTNEFNEITEGASAWIEKNPKKKDILIDKLKKENETNRERFLEKIKAELSPEALSEFEEKIGDN